MKQELAKFLKRIEMILPDAPAEDDCTDAENEIYAEMANLYNALINAGITSEGCDMVEEAQIYGFSVVNSEGYSDGRESRIFLYTSKEKCLEEAYKRYAATWSTLKRKDC